MDVIKLRNFCTTKETTNKTTYGMGENIYKQCTWQRFNFQNTQTTHTTQQQKTQPDQIIDRRLKWTFLQGRHTNG